MGIITSLKDAYASDNLLSVQDVSEDRLIFRKGRSQLGIIPCDRVFAARPLPPCGTTDRPANGGSGLRVPAAQSRLESAGDATATAGDIIIARARHHHRHLQTAATSCSFSSPALRPGIILAERGGQDNYSAHHCRVLCEQTVLFRIHVKELTRDQYYTEMRRALRPSDLVVAPRATPQSSARRRCPPK